MQRYPFGIWLGIVFSLSLALSALYWSESRLPLKSGASWGTVATVNQEYLAATARLKLPDGYKWPKETPYRAADENGDSLAYGAGCGTQWAELYWFDSWVSVAASATTPVARDAATRNLLGFLDTTAFKNIAEQEYYRNMILDAQKGELSTLKEYAGFNGILPNGRRVDE